jgi:glycosyltransferase involved in cell wall biosynthesis
LPLVASALPEISLVVKRHDLGILIAPGDVDQLADALNTLLKNSELRAKYSAHAKQAAATLNWEAQEDELVELYRRIVPSTR